MAHFAELNEFNIVQQVIVVNNDILLDENGDEQEQLGIDFCKSVFGENTNWVQTSYNGSFRGIFAAVDMKYDSTLDEFVNETKTE